MLSSGLFWRGLKAWTRSFGPKPLYILRRLRRYKDPQGCGTDMESCGLLWSRWGTEMRQELDCLLDGDTRHPHKMLTRLSCNWTAPGVVLHGCSRRFYDIHSYIPPALWECHRL
ncbi:hypothetical protein PoB_005243400 [Plakobranchus ocellatus]|uniref:Uncharacterized protein n=1 Tax=Plakobranchus ocellatus TaxID=259542 RepID=A0AAV4C477_9GAST|nr:hypothetical protein PoB_005243400 [Plakobranchus ocellatus]